jgi:hypothetical protein
MLATKKSVRKELSAACLSSFQKAVEALRRWRHQAQAAEHSERPVELTKRLDLYLLKLGLREDVVIHQ